MIKPGDIIYRQMKSAPLFNHYGVYVELNGEPHAIHKTSDKGEQIVTLSEFLAGYELRGYVNSPISGKSSSQIVSAFFSRAEKSFNIVFDNCERFAEEFTGKRYNFSEVIRGLLFVATLTASILILKNLYNG